MRSRNDLIDGWRGISVILVIVGHLVSYRFSLIDPTVSLHSLGISLQLPKEVLLRSAGSVGELGVDIFFVISGYLITSILIDEKTTNGTISIAAFYARRFFRIVPAFAIFLVSNFALRSVGLIEIPDEAFLRSGLYVCDASGFKCSWWLAHTWSLSVEEQFYLIWPCLFVFLPSRTKPLIVIIIALISSAFWFSQAIHFAQIGIGALLASSPRSREIVRWFSEPWILGAAAAFLLLRPILSPLQAIYHVSGLILPLLTALVFFGTISDRGPFVLLVQQRWLQRVGLISYSIYLWQQLGTAPKIWNGTNTGSETLYRCLPFMFVGFVIPAILSYLLLERPFIRIGHKVSRFLIGRRRGRNEVVGHKTHVSSAPTASGDAKDSAATASAPV